MAVGAEGLEHLPRDSRWDLFVADHRRGDRTYQGHGAVQQTKVTGFMAKARENSANDCGVHPAFPASACHVTPDLTLETRSAGLALNSLEPPVRP